MRIPPTPEASYSVRLPQCYSLYHLMSVPRPAAAVNFLLYVLKLAYGEFESRVGQAASPKGAKAEMVEAAVESMMDSFIVNELERACPGVSRDMVRRVLRGLKDAVRVEALGRGPGALWRKSGSTLKKG